MIVNLLITRRFYFWLNPAVILLLLGACSSIIDDSDTATRGEYFKFLSSDFASNYLSMTEALQSTPTDAISYENEHWQAVEQSLRGVDSSNMAEAMQWQYVALRQQSDAVIGYKVALGSEGVQQLFGLNEPVIGILFNGDLLSNAVRVNRLSAKNLAFEPDLLVRIKSEKINSAKTIAEVAAHIDQVSAFIELPDLMVPIAPDSANAFIATNAAVRWGVIGDSIAANADDDFVQRLGTMTVNTYDASGALLSSAPGRALMGHPYSALLFLIEKLNQRGHLLERGDVVSLGAYAAPKKADGLEAVRVEYHGLDPSRVMSANVSFY